MTPSQRDNLLEAHSQAMARIAALEAERDALKTELHQWEESDAARSVLEPVFTVEIGRLEAENARLRKALTKAVFDWRGLLEFTRAIQLMGAIETPNAFREGCSLAWGHLREAEDALARSPEAKP